MRTLKNILIIFIVSLILSGTLYSQKPHAKVHRTQAAVKDKSGWYFAKSTEGHFSVLLPLPFNDFTMYAKDTAKKEIKSYIVGCKGEDGIEFGVVEFTLGNRKIIMKDLLRDYTCTEVKEEHTAEYESIFAKVANGNLHSYVKYVRTKNYLFIMTAECGVGIKDSLNKIHLTFFNSIKFS